MPPQRLLLLHIHLHITSIRKLYFCFLPIYKCMCAATLLYVSRVTILSQCIYAVRNEPERVKHSCMQVYQIGACVSSGTTLSTYPCRQANCEEAGQVVQCAKLCSL